jgi:septation ring formation regulator EzrA
MEDRMTREKTGVTELQFGQLIQAVKTLTDQQAETHRTLDGAVITLTEIKTKVASFDKNDSKTHERLESLESLAAKGKAALLRMNLASGAVGSGVTLAISLIWDKLFHHGP